MKFYCTTYLWAEVEKRKFILIIPRLRVNVCQNVVIVMKAPYVLCPCSDEGLTLETSANTLFTAFSVSTY